MKFWVPLARGPVAEQNKFSTRPSSGGRSGAIAISWRAGSRGSGSPVPGTPPTLALYRLGRGGGGPRRFPVASSMLRPLWRLLLWPSWSGRGGHRRAPSATSRRRGCSRRWGWRQQRTAGAGCDETPPSASVRRRTVGQSPPPLRRIGRPGRSGSPGSGACRTPSYPPRSATGGAPGPLMWTSSDPGPAPWLSSPLARGPSLCAFLQHTWVSITLVQLFQRLGLVDLQEGHGVQGGSGLSSSTVSLGR